MATKKPENAAEFAASLKGNGLAVLERKVAECSAKLEAKNEDGTPKVVGLERNMLKQERAGAELAWVDAKAAEDKRISDARVR